MQAVPVMERGSDDHSAHVSSGATVFVSDRGGSSTVYWMSDVSAKPRKLTPLTYKASDPQLSPSGDRVAFVAATERNPSPRLYLVHVAGGEPIPIASQDAEARNPCWLPDGSAIVYSRRVKGLDDFDIAVVEVGGEPRTIFGGPGNQVSPAVRPDGRSLLFQGADERLYFGEIGSEATPVTEAGFDDPAWSPDGRFVVAEKDGEIRIFSARKRQILLLEGDIPAGLRPTWVDGKTVRVERRRVPQPAMVWLDDDRIRPLEIADGLAMTAPSPSSQSTLVLGCREGDIVMADMRAGSDVFRHVTQDSFPDLDPGWSPDGQSFVYTSTRGGNTDLYIRTLPDLRERRLTRHPRADRMGRFSLSGQEIIFVSERNGEPAIYLLEVETGEIESISTPLGGNPSHPSLSPDGEWVYYRSEGNGRSHIEAYNRATDEQRPLTEGDPGQDVEPTCSPDGIYVAFRRWERGDSDIYIVPALGGDARPVFRDSLVRAGHPDWVRRGVQILFEEGGGAGLWDLRIAGLE